MKESIEAWSDDADVESDELYEFFITLNVGWLCCCKWAVAADSDLSLKCDLTTELVIEWVCDEILSAVWFVKMSNIVNVNCSEVCFLMIDEMKVLDSCMKWCDETFILFLSFAFVIDEIEVDEESLKMTVFWCLENLSWKCEICCDCECKSENNDFEEMTETFIQNVEEACEWVIFWCLTDCLIIIIIIILQIKVHLTLG